MAPSYAIPGISIDGQNIVEVFEAAGDAIERARGGGGPTLIEARTYRFYGHSIGDRQEYRKREEVEEWRTHRDPIKLFRAYMAERQWFGDKDDEAVQKEANLAVAAAVRFAEKSPFPTPDAALTDVLESTHEGQP